MPGVIEEQSGGLCRSRGGEGAGSLGKTLTFTSRMKSRGLPN